MGIGAFSGKTAPRVNDNGDGTHTPIVELVGGGGGGGGTSDTTEATQLLVLAELQNLDTDVGALNDTAAAVDGTGNYSVIAGIKRALLNWATRT